MTTTCPHCSTHLELDPETLAALQGATAFDCPACQGAVPVPPLAAEAPATPPDDDLIVATCTHCAGEFEVDGPTRAYLRGKTYFKCPLCNHMLAVARLPGMSVNATPAPHPAPLMPAVWAAVEAPTPSMAPPPVVAVVAPPPPPAPAPSAPPVIARPAAPPAAEPMAGRPPSVAPPVAAAVAATPPPVIASPAAPHAPASSRTRVFRRLNPKVLILGSAALLVLGGIGFFLASRLGGNCHLASRQTVNEVIRNKFFQDLIATGAASQEELATMAAIRPDGTGFVGVSGGKLTWPAATELAARTGAEVLALDGTPTQTARHRAEWLATLFPSLHGSTAWVMAGGEIRITDLPDILPVTSLDRPRPVLLRWVASAGQRPPAPKLATTDPRPPAPKPAPKLVPAGFVLIPAGEFQMGDQSSPLVGQGDELPVHAVHVSEFFMGKHEVTTELWDSVRAWGLSNGYTDLAAGNGSYASKGASHPVHSISWYDVVKWCNARSQKERLKPCYTVSGAIYKTGSSDAVVCDWDANGYRLPTEAEWEKAARGGAVGKNFPWGTDTITHSQANYSSTALESYDVSPTRGMHPTYRSGDPPWTSPVGSFAPNAYGLHDMTGNLWEWCWDWRGSYTAGAQTDPRGPSSGAIRIYRGGGWSYAAHNCRAASRAGRSPASSDHRNGFRLVRSSVP